ncbi:NrfD/PsrC family molybdoenzyme membrane anchor subunit [Neomoorella humiferrea]|uniref:Putative hydrogenase 2 b cytochrome subunit n=1 Tax=Neomoorella humiferrea TaxID=676965 RepID=A0A2T0AJS4_9FIRM|nr:NrfD/PsrC family molybdoenzyme membrane anchor subunit [Moorella humiferrea]PRR68603.1 putative hydrogenase 2 b cytochrome subunit [Moorella humiferrea]
MRKLNVPFALGLVLLLVSLFTWGYQLKNGLIVTGMRNPFSWGLYIATFAFFVGIAAGGLIVSSSVYLFNLEQLKPFTRIASLSAFASIMAAAVIILPDLGRVDRIYNLLLHPNFRSPLIWDVIVVSAYTILTFLSVYFQLLPDWKKGGCGFLNGWTRKLSQEEVESISASWSRRVAMVGLPVAILIHTITALIFATQASRGWWYTAVLPPDFIAVAVASGTALVLVIALLVAGKERFNQYAGAFNTLARITAGALAVHFFFVAMDILIHWWWGSPEALGVLSLVFNRYVPLYLVEIVLPAFVMIYFFTAKARRSPRNLLWGCFLLFAGVFVHRLMLMFPAFNQYPLSLSLPGMEVEGWHYPVAVGTYQANAPVFVGSWPYMPTVLEVAVDLLPFGLALLIIALLVGSYNFLPEKR